ncbi:hypothetical protein D3C75_868400 [compost metagenome]
MGLPLLQLAQKLPDAAVGIVPVELEPGGILLPLGEPADLPVVGFPISLDSLNPLLLVQPELTACQSNACRHPQQIVQIRTQAALVKIIDIVNQIAVFILKSAEILQMQIPLHPGGPVLRRMVGKPLPGHIGIEEIGAPSEKGIGRLCHFAVFHHPAGLVQPHNTDIEFVEHRGQGLLP